MLGVVAVLHIGSGELAEADSHFHLLRTVLFRADAEHVLACPFLPFRRSLAIAAEHHAFLEVHVHRVAPAVAAVLQLPHFQGAVAAEACIGSLAGQLHRRRNAPRVHAVTESAIGLDGPGRGVGTVGTAEEELAVTRFAQFGLVGGRVTIDRQRNHLQSRRLARFGRLVGDRVHAQVLAAVRVDHQLQELADHRVAVVPLGSLAGLLDHRLVFLGQHVSQRDGFLRPLAGLVLHQVHEIQLVADADPVFGEVDDDVVALGDGLHRQDAFVFLLVAVAIEVHAAVERHGMFHDVAVVGDHVERHPLIRHVGARRTSELAAIAGNFTHHGDFEIARYRAVQQAETVAARADLECGLVLPVDQDLVTEEAVGIERVEPQLAVGIPGLVGYHQVDVVVAVAPGQCRTTGEAQVDAVVERLVAAVYGAVVVHHHGVALVDVRRREIQHVVVEPVGTHGFPPVAADLDAAVLAGFQPWRSVVDEQGFARRAGKGGARVFGAGVDGVVAGQLHRPAIVVVLAGEEIGIGIAIAFRRVVAVVLVGR
ncbi:hypothetical protein D9M71_202480 [compost metagenome]